MAGCWAFHCSSRGWVCENLKSERSIRSATTCGSGQLDSEFTRLTREKINCPLPQAVLTVPCLFQRPFVIVANSNHPGKFKSTGDPCRGFASKRKDYLWETIGIVATTYRRG